MSGLKFHIPDSWKLSELSDIAEINMGQSPSSSDVNEHGEGMIFFQGKAEFGKLYPIPRKYCTKPTKTASAGNILLSVRAPVGPTNIATQTTAIGRGLAAISAYDGLTDPKYLLYYFRYIEPWLSTQGTGSTFKAISGMFIKELVAPTPSFYEQKTIAEKLDTLLAQVDSVKARLEQIPIILKSFRQAVLATAVSGKLTHINAANKLITLGDIAKDIRYGTSKKCSEDEGNTAVLRIPNIGLGYIINKNIKYANFEQKELSALALIEGDLLLIRSNGSVDFVGKVAVISENDTKYLYAGYLIRVRLDQEKAMPKYISYCLQSPQLRQVIENIARSTSGVNNINSKELAALELPLPTLAGQQEIIRRVEQLFAYADTIEKQIDNALARVNNLTQSILAKAFCGELTAQWRAENPELISGENSAAALLKKIKDEREAIKRLPKPKRSAIDKKIGKRMSKQIIKVVEALAQVDEPLSGQQLLVAAGYPSDSNTDDLEKFFLDMRQALTVEKTIVKLERSEDGQDWFSLAEMGSNE